MVNRSDIVFHILQGEIHEHEISTCFIDLITFTDFFSGRSSITSLLSTTFFRDNVHNFLASSSILKFSDTDYLFSVNDLLLGKKIGSANSTVLISYPPSACNILHSVTFVVIGTKNTILEKNEDRDKGCRLT